jgi:organic radical activating enzyme
LAWFVRLSGCNLSCSWCDTPYTWDAQSYDLRLQTVHLTAAVIAGRIPAQSLVVITGGEPLLQQRQPAWADLLVRLHGQGCAVHVETNGTLAPPADSHVVELFAVSPKLGNAGRHRGHQSSRLHPAWVDLAVDGRAVLKIVCRDAADVDEAVDLACAAGWPLGRVWVMPEGMSAATVLGRWPGIADAAIRRRVNATLRGHVLAWGDVRGR